jgi:hypothetical protein
MDEGNKTTCKRGYLGYDYSTVQYSARGAEQAGYNKATYKRIYEGEEGPHVARDDLHRSSSGNAVRHE